MDALKLATPVDVATAKLMGSDVLIGARVCSDTSPPKIDEFTGITTAGSRSLLENTDAKLCRSNHLSSRSSAEEVSLGLVDGMTSGSTILMSEYEGKQIQRKVGKVPRNGSGSFKKPQILHMDNLLPQAEADDAPVESDKLGLHLTKCSNSDKSQAVKQKNNIHGRRGDRRNSKVPMKATYDPSSLKVGLSNFSPANGGSNIFGMYGLKPDVHDISKLMDDISLDELLDRTYKCPNTSIDKGKKIANVTEDILDSVIKAYSIIQLREVQQATHAEEIDIQADKKTPLSLSPSNTSVVNGPYGDDNTLAAGLSKCGKDLDSSLKIESPADKKDVPLYQPRDILERLALRPSKELDSLLQDAMKPAVSSQLIDSRSGKQLSHRVSLMPFPWSHNFNGHHKSSNDGTRISNKSTCQGRWVRIRSNASFIGRGNEDFVDLDSLTYDNSLVPSGKLIYRLPETDSINQQCCQHNPSGTVCQTSTVTLLPTESGSIVHSKMNAMHSPKILAAAQTLCDIASDFSTRISNGILKWPKQPSQKAMKARKSRSSKQPDEFLTPKSETLLDHVVRSIGHGSSSKKLKISTIDRREELSHIHTVLGLSSVSAPRSNRSSPSLLPKESIAEAKNLNGNFITPPLMAPPPRVLDRNPNLHNPQKLRKVSLMDWNRTRS